MGRSSIEWTGYTWNPIKARLKADTPSPTIANPLRVIPAGKVGYHCERISAGCGKCYACTGNARTLPAWGTGLDYTVPNRDKVEIFLDEEVLMAPLRWKRPRKIFPCSMTDWAADFVTDKMMDKLLAVAALCPQHTFQFLTKRTDRLPRYFADIGYRQEVIGIYAELWSGLDRHYDGPGSTPGYGVTWKLPLPNVQLGFSAEDQSNFDARWKAMRKLAAAGWFTWCSYEPALGPLDMGYLMEEDGLECNFCNDWRGVESDTQRIDTPDGDWHFNCPKCGEECAHTPLDEVLGEGLRWLVIGGESGPGARPFDLRWARNTIAQCKAAGVPCFVKQLGADPLEEHEVGTAKGGCHRPISLKDRKGGDWEEWAADLRVRQFPSASPSCGPSSKASENKKRGRV